MSGGWESVETSISIISISNINRLSIVLEFSKAWLCQLLNVHVQKVQRLSCITISLRYRLLLNLLHFKATPFD